MTYTVLFFHPENPMRDCDVPTDQLTDLLVDGVDIGLANVIVKQADREIGALSQAAVRCMYAQDDQAAERYCAEIEYWQELREEALYIQREHTRQRRN